MTIVDRVTPRGVTITVDLAAVRANLVEARRLAGGGKVFAVVKADAYGHGAVAVARALSRADMPAEARADGFAVVTMGEAEQLRAAGLERPILVLQGPLDTTDAERCEALSLWPVIHDVEQHAWYRDWCRSRTARTGTTLTGTARADGGHRAADTTADAEAASARAWLKVDTGMGRLGVDPRRVGELLGHSSAIEWRGVMSHLACADEPGSVHAQGQIDTFGALAVPPGLERSLANSAAVIAWPGARHDWARPGLMLYGCNPIAADAPSSTESLAGSNPSPSVALRAAMRVTTTLLSVKTMEAGQGVGYAQTWHCPERMNIGLARVGYADGLPRVLGPQARVSVGGADCPIVGRVSMDSIAVDLRAAPAARIGDEVELWGGRLSVDALAEAAGTIAYELLTGIRGRRLLIDAPEGRAGAS